MHGLLDWARQSIIDVGRKLVTYRDLIDGRSHEELLELRIAAADSKRDIEIQLVQKKGELAQEKQRCLALGERGRNQYFQLEAEYLEWRGAAIAAKGRIESILAHIKVESHLSHETTFQRKARELLIEGRQMVDKSHDAWHRRVADLLGERLAIGDRQ